MFDPYRVWLSIRAQRRPPTHYDLLGVDEEETDADVIKNALLMRMGHVRKFQTGPQAEDCVRVLRELSAAAEILLDPVRRSTYAQSVKSADSQFRADTPSTPLPHSPLSEGEKILKHPIAHLVPPDAPPIGQIAERDASLAARDSSTKLKRASRSGVRRILPTAPDAPSKTSQPARDSEQIAATIATIDAILQSPKLTTAELDRAHGLAKSILPDVPTPLLESITAHRRRLLNKQRTRWSLVGASLAATVAIVVVVFLLRVGVNDGPQALGNQDSETAAKDSENENPRDGTGKSNDKPNAATLRQERERQFEAMLAEFRAEPLSVQEPPNPFAPSMRPEERQKLQGVLDEREAARSSHAKEFDESLQAIRQRKDKLAEDLMSEAVPTDAKQRFVQLTTDLDRLAEEVKATLGPNVILLDRIGHVRDELWTEADVRTSSDRRDFLDQIDAACGQRSLDAYQTAAMSYVEKLPRDPRSESIRGILLAEWALWKSEQEYFEIHRTLAGLDSAPSRNASKVLEDVQEFSRRNPAHPANAILMEARERLRCVSDRAFALKTMNEVLDQPVLQSAWLVRGERGKCYYFDDPDPPKIDRTKQEVSLFYCENPNGDPKTNPSGLNARDLKDPVRAPHCTWIASIQSDLLQLHKGECSDEIWDEKMHSFLLRIANDNESDSILRVELLKSFMVEAGRGSLYLKKSLEPLLASLNAEPISENWVDPDNNLAKARRLPAERALRAMAPLKNVLKDVQFQRDDFRQRTQSPKVIAGWLDRENSNWRVRAAKDCPDGTDMFVLLPERSGAEWIRVGQSKTTQGRCEIRSPSPNGLAVGRLVWIEKKK